MLCMYIGEGMVSCSSREVSYRSVRVRPKNTRSSWSNEGEAGRQADMPGIIEGGRQLVI